MTQQQLSVLNINIRIVKHRCICVSKLMRSDICVQVITHFTPFTAILWSRYIPAVLIRKDIKELYNGITPDSEEAKALRELQSGVEQIHALFEDAAVDAAKAYAQDDSSEVRYSTRKSFAEQVNDVINGIHNPRYDLYISHTPQYLIELNFSDEALLMRSGKLREILNKHSEMNVELIKKIPEALKDPLLVLKSKTNPSESVVVITDITTSNGDMIIPVWVNQEANYIDIDFKEKYTKANFVASSYGRNVKGLIEHALENEGVLYQSKDTKRVRNLLTRNGLQLSTPLTISNSDISIRQSTEKSQGKISDFENNFSDTKTNGAEIKYSIRNITDGSGKDYGIGVHLDSTLLDNLTDSERIEMVKEYVKEIGGSVFTAYDEKDNPVDITIAKANRRYKNKNKRSVSVNRDLTGYLDKRIKQEAITLIDELVATSKYNKEKKANYSHGWLDNFGKNNWEYWTTYIQDKENTVWKAILNIANSENGEKILYDIVPIKKVGQSVTSDTSATNNSIRQSTEKSQGKFRILKKIFQIRKQTVLKSNIQ